MQVEDDFWGKYWASGALTSMADGFESNYQGVLRSGWETYFASFDLEARLLDIGTGNGAIATIAAEISRREKLDFEIHGADLAEIDPQRTVKSDAELTNGLLRAIVFHPGTATETLPFEDGTIDGVSAQFAFEYADHDAAMAELGRVLRPGGKARFVMHDHDSEVLRRGREQLRQIELIESQAFYDTVDALLPHTAAMASGIQPDQDTERVRLQVNEVGATIGEAARASFSPESLQFAMGFASRALEIVATDGLNAARARLQQGRDELAGAKLRYGDLVRAAGAPGQALNLAELAKSKGFADVAVTEVMHNGQVLVGRQLDMTKPG